MPSFRFHRQHHGAAQFIRHAGDFHPLFRQPHHDLLKRVMLLAHLIAEEVRHALAEQIIIIYRPA